MKPVIAVTTGDPYGIGPEISLKAACRPDILDACRPLLVGDRAHLLKEWGAYRADSTPADLHIPGDPVEWPEVSVSGFAEMGSKQGADFHIEGWKAGPAVFDMGAVEPASGPRGPSAAGGRAAAMYIKQAVGLVRVGSAAAIATAPISKVALQMAGHRWPGHTELLADLCGSEPEDVAMLFVAPDLKVALLSVHESLRDAIARLAPDRIIRRLALLHEEYRRWFGSDPRIAVCALNPHAGEEGMFGAEERDILAPAVVAARAAGVDARGPLPADTLFPRAARGDYDLV